MPAPWLLALGLVIALLVLIPARRSTAGGVSSRVVAAYAVGLWLVGMFLAIRPLGARVLVPFVLVAYLAPFIATPDVVGRVMRRGRPNRPPIKNVTPRAATPITIVRPASATPASPPTEGATASTASATPDPNRPA